jgi:ubiquinone biosynthesis protein
VFRQDYHEVAQLHVECGWVPPDTRVQDFEAAMRAVCEPVFERPISEISFGQLLVYLFQTAARFDMEVQPSLVLLQKTLLNIEGLGRQLYPELNLWDTAQPFLEDWVQRRYSPQSVIRRLQKHAPSLLEQLPQLPELVLDSLQQGRAPRAPINAAAAQSADDKSRRRARARRRRQIVAVAACGAALITALPGGWQQLAAAPTLSWLLLALGLGLLWYPDA